MVRNKHNTPVIIKYLFWKMAYQNSKVIYACINLGEAICPDAITEQSICIDADIAYVLSALQQMRNNE